MWTFIVNLFRKLFGFPAEEDTVTVINEDGKHVDVPISDVTPPPPAPTVPDVEATPVVVTPVEVETEPVVEVVEKREDGRYHYTDAIGEEKSSSYPIRVINGVPHFFSGLQGWTPVPNVVDRSDDPLLGPSAPSSGINYYGFNPFPGTTQHDYDRLQMTKEGYFVPKSNHSQARQDAFVAEKNAWNELPRDEAGFTERHYDIIKMKSEGYEIPTRNSTIAEYEEFQVAYEIWKDSQA